MTRLPLSILAVAGLTLSACVSDGGDTAPEAPAPQCDASRAQSAVGQPYSAALAETARQSANAAEVRQLGPDTMTTMEFNGARLNLVTDARQVVTEARCG